MEAPLWILMYRQQIRSPKRDVIECQPKPLVLMTSQTKTSLHRVSGSNHKENSWVSTHHLKGHVNDHDLPMGFFLLRPKKLGQPNLLPVNDTYQSYELKSFNFCIISCHSFVSPSFQA